MADTGKLYLKCCRSSPQCLTGVSGVYGPGSMLGWYLTILGCLVSWTLHPRHKETDSISADMVAVLLFPLAAASHFTSLTRNAFHNASAYEDLSLISTCQMSKAVEAPARVIFVWTIITVIMYALPALHHRKRGSAVALVLVVCIITLLYTYDGASEQRRFFSRFSNILEERREETMFTTRLISWDGVHLLAYLCSRRHSRSPTPRALEEQILPPTVSDNQTPSIGIQASEAPEPLYKELKRNRVVAIVFCITVAHTSANRWLHSPKLDLSPETWKFLFPETSASLGNYDQALAAVGGAAVLGMNLYSAGKCWYEDREARKKPKLDVVPLRNQQPNGRRWHGQSHDE